MAVLAPFIAAAASALGSGTAAAGAGAAAGAAAAGGTAAAAATGAAALWGTGAATAATAAAAGAGTAAAGLTAAEIAMLGLTAVGVGSTLMTPSPQMDTPTLNEANVMPTEDSEAILKSRQRSMVAQQQRQGRASTMLSDSYDKLGG